ncbi:hypothetical protein QFC21_001226 [Naganishia friedmannii]|uniref:Uncharacterized protein n=1 Tax=Naganishia friedmannii TaxID=89922 RepID=A0ACC2W3W5_9TREE|nr:hypothetical protein QFC21_001226 [Naganishia friedmannii]
MEGLIDNAKKFMASEDGQKMQSTFQQQGGADVDQFLNQSKGSSGDNVPSSDFNDDSYVSRGNTGSSEQNRNSGYLDRDDGSSSNGPRGQRGDTGVRGDTSKAETREGDNDYSGYSGEDSTASGGWGANLGGDSFSRQNQLGADKPASGDGGQGQGRTDDNDTNYDGGRGASGFDASGTSTPAYRQEDGRPSVWMRSSVAGLTWIVFCPDYEDSNRGGKTQGGGSYGTWDANVKGGIKGALIAAGITIPGSLALHRFSPTYRQLPLPAKAFAAVVIAAPTIVYHAETAGTDYERSFWSGTGKRELDRKAQADIEKWNSMSSGAKFQDWAKRNQWTMVGGGWAGSMVIAGAILARNPYLTFSQKLVQARVWAQASTVATLILTGILAGTATKESKPMEEEDHSWRDILEDEEREEKARKAEATAPHKVAVKA